MSDDPDLLPPTIADTTTRQIVTRNVRGLNAGGARTRTYLRQFEPLVTDEPAERQGTDTAPTPLETVSAALIGCTGATVFYTARAMKLEVAGFYAELEQAVDMRGPRGVPGVRPFFEWVTLEVEIYSDEPADRVERLIKNVEFRCPVANLLRSAGVALTVAWTHRPARELPDEGLDARTLPPLLGRAEAGRGRAA